MTDKELLEHMCFQIAECGAPKNAAYWDAARNAGIVKEKLTELMSEEEKALFKRWEDLMLNIRKQDEIKAFCITFQLAFNILNG